ncbi:DNA helicase [Brevibacillus reuszeri]|uniref:Helicase n=1 Tax=Brevibacillus reuszeri TaxID=54915 RepID=A0A0K9YWX5_9BACL|nr:RNA polymerase recycling motor HelD [Brevibacillus reuszeri]KNB73188.1 helicase [Brevibacillus reuszeri]MED1856787.1 RNA polymerase recycling motor HelD [Brevibacillus reuszeri]GED68464.1 DNA helicase [Brevibacillus reuszeri]
MNAADQDRQQEQQRVEQVIAEIHKRIDGLREQVGEVGADIINIRKHFWDDVTVNFEDAIEAVETYASIKQQAEVLSERERIHRHALNQLRTLNRLLHSPYFGRIDFREDFEQHAFPIYLGIASLLDENEEDFLVYDWRAPISSLYYDYSPGPVQYETPNGTVVGEMTGKRQYVIRDGRLLHMFDTGVTIGDELLQEVLGKQADSQMKSIVATIQRDQNRIIRNERSRLVIVSGAAGSGKTSAALQRVAYLLYRYRQILRADQIVLFSPNSLFNSYVSTVLPELGEENMQQTTFQEYTEHRLGHQFELESPLVQMEYVLTAMKLPGYKERLEGIQMKSSVLFMQAIDQYVSQLKQSGILFSPIIFRGKVLISAEHIRDIFYSFDTNLPIPNRMNLVAKKLLGELKILEQRERTKPWVEDEMELLDKDTYAAVYQELRKKKQFRDDTFDDFDREQELLAAKIVKRHFQPVRASIRVLQFIDTPVIYQQLFSQPALLRSLLPAKTELPRYWEVICEQTLEKLAKGELAYEDIPPYLYLQERLEGFQTNNLVRHIFIDEAQDYSPFQFALIQRLFPRAKMTVLGDWNQAIYAHAYQSDSFDAVSSLYDPQETETFVLTKTYRSTRPIVEFTRQIVAGGELIEPFNRDGHEPSVTEAPDQEALTDMIVSRIKELSANGHQTIAVITKTTAEAQTAYEALHEKLPIRLIGTTTTSYDASTLLIPAYLAKGVEFDAVIIYNASSDCYERESERKLFYTACTRAMHELHLYYIGEKSPFLAAVTP